ncbi:hypothetical protein GE061_008776 [Apolygus lucorum]|uniref:Uncharacterized protein n=1 Tax=Apolygus lucorum TaxID=248454 RepID=A0A8S9WNK7_APOLU|nr:hypothetical protein GE061_008776 [Apolygus lucorum]
MFFIYSRRSLLYVFFFFGNQFATFHLLLRKKQKKPLQNSQNFSKLKPVERPLRREKKSEFRLPSTSVCFKFEKVEALTAAEKQRRYREKRKAGWMKMMKLI